MVRTLSSSNKTPPLSLSYPCILYICRSCRNNSMSPNFHVSFLQIIIIVIFLNRQTPQLCTAARHLIVTTSRSSVNVPLKDYIILFAPFFPSAHFSVFIPFLPRDNWLIHQCLTPPPPDPQHHRHTFPEPCLVSHGWHHHHCAAVSSQNSDELNHVPTSVFLIIFLPPPLFFWQENTQVVRLHHDSSCSWWSVSVRLNRL